MQKENFNYGNKHMLKSRPSSRKFKIDLDKFVGLQRNLGRKKIMPFERYRSPQVIMKNEWLLILIHQSNTIKKMNEKYFQ
jgi:hypothetical protein